MDILDFILMQPAIQNMDFLRQLISEARGEQPQQDAERLRMLRSYSGTGTVRPEERR